mgnify:CR=1 FL=1
MPEQFIFTTVPNGIEGGKLKMSVCVSMRLSGTGRTLANFPQARSWGDCRFAFNVLLSAGGTTRTLEAAVVSQPNGDAYKALFRNETPVRPFAYTPQGNRPIASFSTRHVRDFVQNVYGNLASIAGSEPPPTVHDLANGLLKDADIYRPGGLSNFLLAAMEGGETPDLSELFAEVEGLQELIQRQGLLRPSSGRNTQLLTVSGFAQQQFQVLMDVQATAFRNALEPQTVSPRVLWHEARVFQRPISDLPVAVRPPQLEFHEALALIGEHPSLARALGFIFDITVDVPPGMAGTGRVSVAANITGPSGNIQVPANPKTVFTYNADSNIFLPAHRPSAEYSAGFLNVSPTFCDIVMFDIDGAASKTLDFAQSVRNLALNDIQSRIELEGIHRLRVNPRELEPRPVINPGAIRPGPLEDGEPRDPEIGTTDTEAQPRPPIAPLRPATGPATAQPRPLGGPTPAPGPVVLPAGDMTRFQVRPEMLTVPPDRLNFPPKFLQPKTTNLRPDDLNPNARNAFVEAQQWYLTTHAQPPRIRSFGIGVSRHNRSFVFRRTVRTQDENNTKANSPDTIELYYEDMVRGYRMDVQHNGRWYSLTTRTGQYNLPGGTVVGVPDEESWVSTAVASDPNRPDEQRLHELVARWTGYSLVNQRPGQAIQEDNSLGRGSEQLDPSFPVSMTFKPRPGSMPALRFGRRYKVRMRLATVAGTGPTLDSPTPGPAFESQEVTYLRYENVPSPTPYQFERSKEGESAGHIVIRKYANGSTETARRQLIAPAGEVSLSELHGMLDTNGKPDPAKYALIQERDQMEPLTEVVPNRVTRLPYLADPAASGVCIQNAPHTPNPLRLAYPGSWPNQQSLLLNVQPGAGASTASGDTFTMNLVPGEIDDAFLSSTVSSDRIEDFGLAGFVPSARRTEAQFRQRIAEGVNWMVTPTRSITMVFATQIPEQDPAVVRPVAARTRGGTFANVAGMLRTHTWTTASVDFVAKWVDQVDLLEETRREAAEVVREQVAFKVKVDRARNQPVAEQGFNEQQEFNDTKHRRVKYDLIGHTAFRQYFPRNWPLPNDPNTAFTRTTTDAFEVVIPSSRRPDPPVVEYVVPAFNWSTTRNANSASSTRSGGTVRVYLRRPWFSSGNDEKLAVVLLRRGGVVTANAPEDPRIAHFNTKIGADPIFRAGNVPAALTPANFIGSEPPRDNLFVEELGDAGVALAVPYPVEFDADKQMWYADVQINFGSEVYTPFVRLALARYQPFSVDGLHLSRLEVADIIQLQMSRTAVVTFSGPRTVRAEVIGQSGETTVGGNFAIGTVEEKVGPDPDSGWRPVVVGGRELTEVVPIRKPSGIQVPTDVVQPRPRPGPTPSPLPAPGPTPAPRPAPRPSGEDAFEAAVTVDQDGQPVVQPRVLPQQPIVQPETRPDLAAQPNLGILVNREGTFTLPEDRTSKEYRLVIREYERYASDSGDPIGPESESRPPATIAAIPVVGERLVYVDVIPLSN